MERELSIAASPRVSANRQLTHCAIDDAAETPAKANSMSGEKRPEAKGRGAYVSPPNRFGQVHAEDDFGHVEHDEEYLAGLRNLKTQYLPDESRTVVSKNDSPDLNFNYSLNPYRGCLHGCRYFARPLAIGTKLSSRRCVFRYAKR